MIKFLFLGRRAAGLTRRSAQAHLRDVHGRMVVLPPADAGAMPRYYAQNHVIDGAYPAGDHPHAIERDLVTELQFESLAAMRASVATPYYLANLRPDEPRFVDDRSVVRLNVAPRSIVDGPRTSAKLFVLASRTSAADDACWSKGNAVIAQSLAAFSGVTALTENVVLSGPDGSRFADSVFEAWLDDPAAALTAATRGVELFDPAVVDCDRSLLIVAEEYTEERLRLILR